MSDDPKLSHPTPSARQKVRELAAEIVESVRADARMPLPMSEMYDGTHMRRDIEALAFVLSQEIEALARERDRNRAAIWAVIDMFDGAVANFESRGKGGQHVPYHGDFASMPPSAATQMQRWSRDLRASLRDEWPTTREEFAAMYPNTSATALDEMFKERMP